MNQFNINHEFNYSLNTLINSKENFFEVRLPANEILKINPNSSGCAWVLEYKSNLIEPAKELKKNLKINIKDGIFCFVYYFFQFILPDILMLNKFLPIRAKQILDIGAGIGLFSLYLNHFYGSVSNISIIEVDKLSEIKYHKKEKENLILKKPLHVLDLAKDFLHKNNTFNVSFIDSNKVYNKLNKPYDLVVSLRSWGFLVDLDEYLDFVNENLALNGTVIIDINKRTIWKKKFERYFNNTKIINEYVAHHRMIGTKK